MYFELKQLPVGGIMNRKLEILKSTFSTFSWILLLVISI